MELLPSWTSAMWGECLNYRRELSESQAAAAAIFSLSTQLTPTPAPLGSLDTPPRSRLLLQTKMAATSSKCTSLENPMEK